jgi:hypothetical protein
VQKLHFDAREKFAGNNELIKTRSARTSGFIVQTNQKGETTLVAEHYDFSL